MTCSVLPLFLTIVPLTYKAIVEDFRQIFFKPGLKYSENVMKLILLFSFTERPTSPAVSGNLCGGFPARRRFTA